MGPFEVFVADDGDPLPLSETLRQAYGGGLSLPAPHLYANFVQSVDGVVAVPGAVSSGSLISGKSAADRFVMALLRAAAGAVLVGAGTLRDSPGHHWTATHVYPELEAEFAALRTALALAPQPRLMVLTRSGDVDTQQPAIQAGATFLTTTAGAARLEGRLPAGSEVRAWDGDGVPLGEALDWIRGQGHARVLSEAGPRVNAQLVAADLLEDLFVTVSPVLAGRDGSGQLGLVEGQAFLPGRRVTARLASGRRSADLLLLRYSLG